MHLQFVVSTTLLALLAVFFCCLWRIVVGRTVTARKKAALSYYPTRHDDMSLPVARPLRRVLFLSITLADRPIEVLASDKCFIVSSPLLPCICCSRHALEPLRFATTAEGMVPRASRATSPRGES